MAKKVIYNVLLVCFCIYLCILIIICISSSNTVGVIKDTINTEKSSRSVITIQGKKGEKLNFKYSSSVKQGTLNIQFTDSEGNIIETFEAGVSSGKSVVLNKDDEYILSVNYDSFIGKFKVVVKQSRVACYVKSAFSRVCTILPDCC